MIHPLCKWTWVWVGYGSWWWTGKPGVLQYTGSQRVGHNWATELSLCKSTSHQSLHFSYYRHSHTFSYLLTRLVPSNLLLIPSNSCWQKVLFWYLTHQALPLKLITLNTGESTPLFPFADFQVHLENANFKTVSWLRKNSCSRKSFLCPGRGVRKAGQGPVRVVRGLDGTRRLRRGGGGLGLSTQSPGRQPGLRPLQPAALWASKAPAVKTGKQRPWPHGVTCGPQRGGRWEEAG